MFLVRWLKQPIVYTPVRVMKLEKMDYYSNYWQSNPMYVPLQVDKICPLM
jgi:hypothetical protein